ncbi:LURP-one-related/scramblase family protein [Fervidibacillus albus]|uniref:LURP-one-related family protein n=1 Tax=Fervidibacillus albus TaxID=2980026 RepID=A0A9E8LSU6_9BACI|nr:LURP-one-related family protein [Fervidibacillus albus]WAA08901.1 LURP-one-related family protein [Fervidibacillus albus]
MKELHIKQKVFSLGEKFTVKDENGQDLYFVEGSFLKIPKTFTITDSTGKEVAHITKKMFSFLPTFYVEVNGQEELTIKKLFSFFKPRYTVDSAGVEVHGNWWEMEFQVMQHGHVVGEVSKEWFTWGDSYKVKIYNEEMEHLMIAFVVAIDCVKADEAAASSMHD